MLGFFELPDEEIPEENIWHHPARIEEWFEAVKQRRETGHRPIDEAEDVDMTQNESSREIRELIGG